MKKCIKPYAVDIEESNEEVFKPKKRLSRRPIRYLGLPRMNWKAFHRLNVIYAFLDDLEYNNPSICTVGTIGHSVEGREIKLLKLSNSNANNDSVWIDAGIHSREWITPAVATYIANEFSNNFDKQPDSVKNKDWYILPVLNPDGYEFTHTGDRMWRKNRSWYGQECVGVDLNRNFSVGWGQNGSSEIPTHAFFRGSEPFSEPESAAMRDFIENSNIRFKLYLTFHSFGQVIIFPFGFSQKLCPDYMQLLEGATVMSRAIHECTGNIYRVGISQDVMYSAAGTSTDWSYGAAKIPFCYLIELCNKKHKFGLPKEEILITCKEILSAVKALVEFIDTIPTKIVNVRTSYK